ncbi:hypothetical protein, partial [Escherichia coli]|uniref:hypothetical protein n=1 Tax=Escherichia coli TaxID=562 RepID=UPI00390C4A00
APSARPSGGGTPALKTHAPKRTEATADNRFAVIRPTGSQASARRCIPLRCTASSPACGRGLG